MARVYRAEHETLRRDVALKVLRPGALAGRDALERFLQEARITAGLQHANIVQVFDVGVHDELP
jgi:serine/threonine protein kinase